jgi:8-oxo-dGTP pyrophosphatase MutT (NUDIX family)
VAEGGFRLLGEEIVHEGPVVRVARVTVAGPDRSTYEREVVHHPGAVAVVPVLDDGTTVILVRQYRSALDDLVLELPAGKCDVAGEAAELTASRELEEEIGCRAGHLEQLCVIHNSPGFSDERVTIFLASRLEQGRATPHGIEEEHMVVEHVSLADVDTLVESGRITDAKTVVGLLVARDKLVR